ncbi:hypothetical protein C3L23_02205 [Nautilia sp. PV-1]|uniref:hypothetical protein n=1 Tax=Nautilia sp. PV-1 TaxID=2579250 RepID=UPI000FDC40C5|nr:hypothetical protein [Nautilia sp. PV-1]AZV46125.1 hypothetical protein C3L23_02205 [Nautilia sp. PV-1]
MEFLYSLSLAFKSLLNKELTTVSVINGIFWAIVWFGLSFLLWDPFLIVTSVLINILPFKFLQVAGAEFILMIFWLQMILITLGVIFSLFNQLLSKKILPVFISLIVALFWSFVFMHYYDGMIEYIQHLIRIFPFTTIEKAVSVIFNIFVFYSFYIASLYLGFLFISIKKVNNIIKNEYPDIEIPHKFSRVKIFYILIRDLFFFLVLLFLTYPLLFIPVLNIFVIIFLWSFLIKNALSESVKMEFGCDFENKKLVWFYSIFSVLFNFIPVVNLFAPAIGILSFSYYCMEQKLDKEI